MFKIVYFQLFIGIFLHGLPLSAENVATESNWADGLLEPVSYGRPFMSELHGATTKIDIAYNKEASEYNLQQKGEKFERPYVSLDLAVHAPLYSRMMATEWGFSISLPLSIHVLEDLWGPITAPVIDTDYRFGSPKIAGIYYVSGSDFIRNISMSWLPLFHECTHIGDEIVIYRKDTHLPITRLNVSYEYTELQITVNDPEGSRGNLHSLRVGGLYRLSNRGHGWFSVRPDAELTEELILEDSKIRLEYYLNYQYQNSTWLFSGDQTLAIFSLEARSKARYGVPIYKRVDDQWEKTDVEESRLWAFNVYAGFQYYPKQSKTHSLGVYLHGYKGVNPYGQLRNYPGYKSVGLSFVFDI